MSSTGVSKETFGSPYIFIYGAFIFMNVFAYTELMDRKKYAMYLEIAKSALGLGLIYWMGDWFGASNSIVPWFTWFVAAYQILSAAVVALFVLYEINKDGKEKKTEWQVA